MQLPTDTISVIAEYLPTRQDIENISTIFEDIKIVECKEYYNTYKIGHVLLSRGENANLVKISQFCESLDGKSHEEAISLFNHYITDEVFLNRNFLFLSTARQFLLVQEEESPLLLDALLNRISEMSIEDISRLGECTPQQRADFMEYIVTDAESVALDWISKIDESATESTNLEIWDQFFGDKQFFLPKNGFWVAHGMNLYRLTNIIIDASYTERIEFFEAFMKTRFVDLVFDLAMRSRKEYHNCSTRLLVDSFRFNPEYARLVLQHPRFVADAEYLVSQEEVDIDDLYEFDPVLATVIEAIERDY